MYPTKETLSAFIDGELDPTEREQVAVLVNSDPRLKGYIVEQEQLRASLHAAFAPIIAEPIPDRLLAIAAETPISFRVRLRRWLGAAGGAQHGNATGRFIVPALTMGLGLIVGVAVERTSIATNDFATSASTGAIVARAELAQTLDQRLAAEEQKGAARIGVTFRDKTGALCRSFEVSRDSSTTDGFACHSDGEWQVGALVSRPPSPANPAYTLAGSSMPDAIRDAISAHIEGVPLDAAAERRARDRGWN
jgi:hypothetical protein